MTFLRSLALAAIACLLFGADSQTAKKAEPQYEMTRYVVGLFHRGPNSSPQQTDESRRIQEGHMANIRKMAETGKLIVAGPFTDGGDLRGILIFKLDSVDEARALVEADPAVQAGRLTIELHPWFAAAGLRVNPPKNPAE